MRALCAAFVKGKEPPACLKVKEDECRPGSVGDSVCSANKCGPSPSELGLRAEHRAQALQVQGFAHVPYTNELGCLVDSVSCSVCMAGLLWEGRRFHHLLLCFVMCRPCCSSAVACARTQARQDQVPEHVQRVRVRVRAGVRVAGHQGRQAALPQRQRVQDAGRRRPGPRLHLRALRLPGCPGQLQVRLPSCML